MDDDAMRAWAAETEARMAAEAEVRRLTAEVARLAAERDAAAAHIRKWGRWQANRPSEAAMTEYAIRGGARPAHADPPPQWDEVRRAAGLEEEAPR